jgi:endonuclease/exonuclease/phosphatase (EEP) superfamily protein YafD
MKATDMCSANKEGIATYPSRSPKKEFDFVLYQDGIDVTNFEVPDIRLSDHRPIICDFELR